jgi:hypothetical protein
VARLDQIPGSTPRGIAGGANSGWYRRAAIVFLTALFALNVYRAATQSFTTDEAYSWRLYIGATPFNLFRQYDANLHVLHTLLTWASVKLFGLSELTFRIPSLLACAAYFAAVYRLCELAFGASPMFLLGTCLLTVNPLIEDHMSIGRGYGLALAFFAWAFVEALRSLHHERRLPRLAVWLALSVAANLTFLFPAAALLAMVTVVRLRNGSRLRTTFVTTFKTLTRELFGPWLVLTFLFLVLPFSRMVPGQLYFGVNTIPLSARTLLELSIGNRHLSLPVVTAIAALAFAGCAGGGIALWRRRNAEGDFALLAAGTFTLTACLVIASHMWFGVLYPVGRTGLYFVFLLPLCLLPLARWRAGAGALALLCLTMAQGIRWDRYMEWRFDASNRDIMARIESRHIADSGSVRILCSVPMANTLRLYRAMHQLDWVNDIVMNRWERGFDYYVIGAGDSDKVAELDLQELSVGAVSGTILAVPSSEGSRR